MLDISKVPVIDNDVTISIYMSISNKRCIKLIDTFSRSAVFFPESQFKKYFNMFKDVLENEEKYKKIFASARGCKWFRPKDIDSSLSGGEYFILERVPIYLEMFKHVVKYKVCLDRDSLLSHNLNILEAVNNKIQKRKKLNKIEGLPYLNL
jgi:hypothetical protein